MEYHVGHKLNRCQENVTNMTSVVTKNKTSDIAFDTVIQKVTFNLSRRPLFGLLDRFEKLISTIKPAAVTWN